MLFATTKQILAKGRGMIAWGAGHGEKLSLPRSPTAEAVVKVVIRAEKKKSYNEKDSAPSVSRARAGRVVPGVTKSTVISSCLRICLLHHTEAQGTEDTERAPTRR